jgi:hypothetical protein
MAPVDGSHDFDWEADWEIGDDGEPWCVANGDVSAGHP